VKPEVIISNARRSLHAAPINRDWILEGTPEATGCPIFETSDRGDNVHEWQCSPGRFVWHYGIDEIVYIIEGRARIKDLATGVTTNVAAGTSILFQCGSSAEWTVDERVRKIAINHIPLSPKLVRMRAAWRRLKRLFGKHEAPKGGGLSNLPLGDEPTV